MKGHIPYRGESYPPYPKKRRQTRDPRREHFRDQLNIAIYFLLSVLTLVVGMVNYQKRNVTTTLAIFILVFILGLFLTVAIYDGTKKINKFRDGYDFDASIVEENKRNEENQKSETEY